MDTHLRPCRAWFSLAVLCTCLLGTALADSPQWRGANRDGHSSGKGLANGWNKDGPPLLWSVKVGLGYSAISIQGDDGYVSVTDGGNEYLLALDLKQKGKEKWRAKIAAAGKGGGPDYVGIRSTPAIGCDGVYVLGSLGDLVKVDKAKGKELWRKHLVKDFGGQKPDYDYSESLLVTVEPKADDPKKQREVVVATPGGRNKSTMVTLEGADGKLVWTGFADLDRGQPLAGASSPIIATVGKAQTRAYVTMLLRGNIVAFEAATGKFLFENAGLQIGGIAAPTCLYSDGRVFGSCGYTGGGILLDVSGDEVKVAQKDKALDDVTNSAILSDGVLLATENATALLRAADWKTLKLLNEPKITLGEVSAGMTLADGKLIVSYANGVVSLFSIGKAPKELANFVVGDANPSQTENRWATPVVEGDKLYLHSKDVLYCWDLSAAANGKPVPPRPPLPPVVAQKNLEDFDIAKFTGFVKGDVTVMFSRNGVPIKGTGKITKVDATALEWTLDLDEPPFVGFPKSFTCTWSIDKERTAKFAANAKVLGQDVSFKFMGKSGKLKTEEKILSAWYQADEPLKARGRPYTRSETIMKDKTLRMTMIGGSDVTVEVTPK